MNIVEPSRRNTCDGYRVELSPRDEGRERHADQSEQCAWHRAISESNVLDTSNHDGIPQRQNLNSPLSNHSLVAGP